VLSSDIENRYRPIGVPTAIHERRVTLAGGLYFLGMSTQHTPGGEEPSRGARVTSTFVFADIAGFTALTEAHGDEEAADLIAHFAQAVKSELPASGVHVKTIGDALMLRIDDPAEAVRFAMRVTHDVMPEHGAPAVRVGMHHGSAVARGDDYFGAAVNLAARVSDVASGGEVLVTGETAAMVPRLDGVLYETRGLHQLRNVAEPVELFAALREGEHAGADLAIDPVCRMAVDTQRATGRLEFGGATYFFCSLRCAGLFAGQPEAFVRNSADDAQG
jgi:adenylate cyclase